MSFVEEGFRSSEDGVVVEEVQSLPVAKVVVRRLREGSLMLGEANFQRNRVRGSRCRS